VTLLSVVGLAGLKCGLKWTLWCEDNCPSAVLVPVPILVAVSAWLGMDRLLQRTGKPASIGSVCVGVSSVLVSLGCYGLFVILGSRGTAERWIVVFGWLLSCCFSCLVASKAFRDVQFSGLIGRRWKLRLLAAGVGLTVCGLFVAVTEFTCGLLLARQPAGPAKVYEGDYLEQGALFRQDQERGIALEPRRRVSCRLIVDDREVWNVRYSTDEFGRRRTVFPGTQTPTATAVFFGCSFLFGEGSEDADTIPSCFCKESSGYLAANYGVPGWGTQHMLALLESGQLPAQMFMPAKLGVYLYLPEIHEARVVGDMDIVNGFGSGFPYYELNATGQPERKGSFASGRPVTSLFYGVLGKSRTRALLGLNFPRRQPQHYLLTAAVIARARDLFLQQFPDSRFIVVAYPDPDPETLTLQTCRKNGLEVLDLRQLFDPAHPSFQHEGDGHPTPAANAAVASAIVKYLQSAVSEDTGQ
jgi:hypothetical protein